MYFLTFLPTLSRIIAIGNTSKIIIPRVLSIKNCLNRELISLSLKLPKLGENCNLAKLKLSIYFFEYKI